MILKLNNRQTPCKRKGQEDRKYLCTFVFVSFFYFRGPVPEMTYNVFSGTLNPTHFTSLTFAVNKRPLCLNI